MKKLKKTIFGFCIFLLASFILLIPFSVKTSELDSRFGINAFVLNRYNWEEWDKPISLLKELRVSWTREEFVWNQIEPKKGDFDWSFYDKAFEQLSSSDINVLGILDYSASWATEDATREGADKYMPNIEDWINFVDKVVERYGRQVKYWQIWNEENIVTFFKPEPDPEKYLEILKSAHKTIKARDKNAKIVLGGTSGVDIGYLEALKELGADQYFDILAVHPYRFDFKSAPETNGFMKDLRSAEKIAEEFGDKPIWLTEFGWPTDTTEGISEETQADYLVRTYLMSFSFPDVKKLFWYDFRDDGDNPDYREHNFGLIDRDYSKKKSYYAYKNLIDLLEYSNFYKDNSNTKEGLYDFIFSRGNDEIRAIWKVDGEKIISFDKLYVSRIYNIIGEDIYFSEGNEESINIAVSSSPIFVVSKNKKKDVKDEKNYDYEYVDQSSYLSINNEQDSELWLKLKNTGTANWQNYGSHPLLLGTCRDIDRKSIFFVEDSWIGENRSAKMNEKEVAPGEVGTFGFKIKPSGVKDGDYKEYFCPVVEGVTWLKDIGIYWDIKIEKEEKDKEDYDYEYISQSENLILFGGQEAVLRLKLKNTGNESWKKNELNLGTSKKKDRISSFTYDWLSSNRIVLEQDIVKTGEIGSFVFKIKAPQKKGIYKEYFQPVVEGLKWLKDIGIYWEVVVE